MPEKFSRMFWNLLTLALWLSVTFLLFRTMTHPDLAVFIRQTGIFAPAVIIFLFAATAPTPVTAEILLLFSGAAFGPVIGSLTNIIGVMASSMVEYFLGKRLFNLKSFSRMQQKLPGSLKKLPVSSPVFLIAGKLIPWMGTKIVNIAAGAYRVPLSRQIWTSLVTCLPGALFWGIGGDNLMRLFKSLL